MRKHRVKVVYKVVYKSGAIVKLRCAEFTVNYAGAEITKLLWVNARPEPLFIGVGGVAAVYSRGWWQL